MEGQTKTQIVKDAEANEEEEKTGSPRTDPQGKIEKPLSKNQLKRQKREEIYLKKRGEKKAERKLKEKEKKLQLKILKEANEPEKAKKQEDIIDGPDTPAVVKKMKTDFKKDYKENLKKGVPIIIDLSFQDKMTEKELKSLCNQLGYCHGVNKKFEKPARLTLSSYKGELKRRLEIMGFNNWGIMNHEGDYINNYPKESLVYLTGDADVDMEEIDPSKVYIIGGMVDHNRLKNATFNKAKAESIAVQRFPLQKYMKLKTSTILAVNHVFEVLLRLANGENWEKALTGSIPKRKVMEFMNENEKKEGEESASEQEEKS